MELKDKIQEVSQNTLAAHLGIEILEASKDLLRASMPVDHRTKQPAGLLHGGASLVLAETLASIGGLLQVQERGNQVVGQEINANHLRPVKEGLVYGEARPIHLGQTSQVWEVRISDERGRLVCISRCTLRVL